MKQFFNDHFDMVIIFTLSVLLIVGYIYTKDETIKTLMVGAVGGTLGMATKRQRSVEVSGDESKVSVSQP